MRGGISLLTCVGLLFAGCAAESRLRGELQALEELLTEAETAGGVRCAPLAMAVGRSHLEFANHALDKGQRSEANYHHRIAEPNVQVARRLADACADIPEPVSVVGDQDGDGLDDDADRCPAQPEDMDGWEDNDGCPEDQDLDGDGIPASLDLCELEAEDSDGYLDQDGCPEPDNDLDGLLDADDQCAAEPEDLDGVRDDDGCPDLDNDGDSVSDQDDQCPNELGPADNQGCPKAYENVRVTRRAIRIDQEIFFRTGRSRIQARSYRLLNTVAQVLTDFPGMTVEIQGHTDNRGSDQFNLRLSQQRADSVRQYLVGQGIDAGRLTARGFGETRPVETNRTAEGRSINRRVEFLRTDSPPEGQQ